MSFIEIEQSNGWFCNNDLLLICERERPINECLFIDEIHRRFVPQVNFNDTKLFPSLNKKKQQLLFNEIEELNCLSDCKEYVRKTNDFYHRKQLSINQQKKSTRKRLSRFHD